MAAPQLAPNIMSNFVPDPKHPLAIELGMGLVDAPFDIPNLRIENGEAEAHTRIGWFRSVNNIAARVRDPVLRRRDRATNSARDPKDFLLELIGPARIVDLRKQVTTQYWNNGEPTERLSDRHRTPAPCDRARGRTGRLGPARCRKAVASASRPIAAS